MKPTDWYSNSLFKTRVSRKGIRKWLWFFLLSKACERLWNL